MNKAAKTTRFGVYMVTMIKLLSAAEYLIQGADKYGKSHRKRTVK